MTISNEAFAILTIENNWGRWIDMAVAEAWKTSPVATKWTVTRDKTATAEQCSKATNKATKLNHRLDLTVVGRRKAYYIITNSSMK
jgi:hypothetical protein